MAQNNNPSILKEAAKGALRGAASGGGFAGSVARGVQTGIGIAQGIGGRFIKKPVKNASAPTPKPNFVKKQPSVPNNTKFRKSANPTPKPSAPKPSTPKPKTPIKK